MEPELNDPDKLRVIDYGTASRGGQYRRLALAAGVFLRRHWVAIVIALASWQIVAYLRAGVLARRSVTLDADFSEDDILRTGSFEVCASSGNLDVLHYEAQVVKARIGNVTWIPVGSPHIWGRPVWPSGSYSPDGFKDTVPNGCTPTPGGTVTITYTLDVTASPNPWRSFFYVGNVKQTIERCVTVQFPSRN